MSVSVPSTGRSGLQPAGSILSLISMSSFSTLYGSKWVATGRKRTIVGKRPMFQYPLRVEVGCNAEFSFHDGSVKSFSTLYGSKWVATFTARDAGQHTFEFQYPLRVEVGCNHCGHAAGKKVAQVSVPSTGRSGLQRSLLLWNFLT